MAVDAQGNFVIVWTDEVSPGHRNIKAQRFTYDGITRGGIFTVTDGQNSRYEPDVAMADNGDFVVSYTLDANATDQNVHARRFNSAGAYLGKEYVADSIYRDAHRSSVARTADGRFAIAWQEDELRADGTVNSNIRLRRFGPTGDWLSLHDIASTSAQETRPDVAMDRDGNAIVVYETNPFGHWDIRAKTVDKYGTMMSGAWNVAGSSSNELRPTVAVDLTAGDGDYVVAYAVPEGSGFPPSRVYVREMSPSSVKATHDLGLQSWHGSPSIAINRSDVWFVAYTSGDRPDDDSGGIFGWRGIL